MLSDKALENHYYYSSEEIDEYFNNNFYLSKIWNKLNFLQKNQFCKMAEHIIDEGNYIGKALNITHAFPRDFTLIDKDYPSFVIPIDIKLAAIKITGILVEGKDLEQIKVMNKHVGVEQLKVSVIDINSGTKKPTYQNEINALLSKYNAVNDFFRRGQRSDYK